jgi:hypothetical protein
MKKPAIADASSETAAASSSGSQLVEVKGNTLPAELGDELAGMNTGLENVSSRDLMIPRLTILQALSPQLNERKPEFIPNAKVGMFCDTAVGECYTEMLLLPCYFATVYLEWAPRATNKGLVHNHGMDASIKQKCKADGKGRLMLENGNYVAETATYFALNITAGGRRSFLPLSSTQLKASRRWMTLITNERLQRSDGTEFQPPIFYRSWKASITHESNSQGDWFGWKFEPHSTIFELDPTKNLLREAKDFLEQARSGLVQGDLSSFADDGTGDAPRENDDSKAM